ncbi:MAG TPA: type II toxin-antitoxin system Y4mF family antitoxin [Planctomycetota bacterium]|nr:type II toxin-antitoxin system Y4mF family antitoxin [Planctomycetota bacterium]
MLTISNTADLGAAIRRARKAHGLRQPDLAGAAGTSIRFLSELERGKPTAQIGRVLHVLRMLGLTVRLDGLPPTGEST